MVLDSKFELLRNRWGITNPEDYCHRTPEDILSTEGVGEATLDHLRIYLAAHGLTLKNDRTPEYWQQHLSAVKIGTQIGDFEDGSDRAIATPFTILIDSAEQQPFTFLGIHADSDRKNRLWLPQTAWRAMGRHPISLGDYSLDGFVGRVQIERKSVADLQTTVLGFGDGHRDRFKCELAELEKCECAMVVIEGTQDEVIDSVRQFGKRTESQLRKALHRSIISFQQDYPRVQWSFNKNRRWAEVTTFRYLERFWRKKQEAAKQTEKLIASL